MVPLQTPNISPASPTRPHPAPDLSKHEFAFLSQLRMSALRCRVASRADLFEACAMLTLDTNAAQMAFSDALMKCLKQALGRAPVLYRPGVDQLSFDEHWLLALARAHAREDRDSFLFLIASRVDRSARRNLAFLVARISDGFSLD